jgi:hypothetical protein
VRRASLSLVIASLLVGVHPAQACNLRVPREAHDYKAVVVGPSPPQETGRETKIAMLNTGGAPTPRYLSFPHILVDFIDDHGAKHRIISAVTDGAIPVIGASVTVRSRHLDPSDECHFIPWTVVPAGSNV